MSSTSCVTRQWLFRSGVVGIVQRRRCLLGLDVVSFAFVLTALFGIRFGNRLDNRHDLARLRLIRLLLLTETRSRLGNRHRRAG